MTKFNASLWCSGESSFISSSIPAMASISTGIWIQVRFPPGSVPVYDPDRYPLGRVGQECFPPRSFFLSPGRVFSHQVQGACFPYILNWVIIGSGTNSDSRLSPARYHGAYPIVAIIFDRIMADLTEVSAIESVDQSTLTHGNDDLGHTGCRNQRHDRCPLSPWGPGGSRLSSTSHSPPPRQPAPGPGASRAATGRTFCHGLPVPFSELPDQRRAGIIMSYIPLTLLYALGQAADRP